MTKRRVCNKCGVEKRLTEFSRFIGRSGARYRQGQCKRCKADWMKADRVRDPVRYAEHDLKQNYGLTTEEYNKMAEAQSGVCAICHQPEKAKRKRLHVDHNHATGKIRGLLCLHCNYLLGHAYENPEILGNAVAYLAADGRIW